MSYIGNNPVTQSFISGTDYFNGTGAQTAFTLSRTVASINDIQVTVNNVVQQPNDAYTISGTTLTMTSAPSSGTNNVYVRYLSTTTQAITPSQNTVSWNTLDSNVQGDLGISFKNRIINSNMVIDQRNAGASVTPTDTQYVLDRWSCRLSQASKYTVQQNAGSVTPPAGFTNYLGVTSSSAYSVTSGDYFAIEQNIEGYNYSDFSWGTANAKAVTLSFWVRSSLTGTFGGGIRNGTGSQYTYPFSYTISAANTWEQKSITIAAPTSTWNSNTTNGLGVSVTFGLGVGSTYSGTAGAWTAAVNALSSTGATSVVGTNGATWYITGVQLEVGTQATTFTTAGGSYGAELALCQRYYYVHARGNSQNIGAGSYYNSTTLIGFLQFQVSMRVAPTLVVSSGTNHFAIYRNDASDEFDTFTGISEPTNTSATIRNTSQVSGTAGQTGVIITANASSSVAFNSEL
jgi:hypothetical protein